MKVVAINGSPRKNGNTAMLIDADGIIIGSPNKFSMVVAENEKESPWKPYHVDKGFKAEESTVTALCVVGQTEVQDLDSNTPEGLLYTYVHTICGIGNGSGILASLLSTNPSDAVYLKSIGPTKYGHEPVLLLPHSAAKVIAEAGWTKDDVRAYLFEHARVPRNVWYGRQGRFRNGKGAAQKWQEAPSDCRIPIVYFPEAFQIIVVGGRSHAFIGALGQTLPYVKSGKFRLLGSCGTKRSVLIPDVPTIVEGGLPGFEINQWWGVLAPAGTPVSIVDRLNRELKAGLTSDEIMKQFKTQGAEADYLGAAAFLPFLEKEVTKWQLVVTKANIKLE